MKSSAKKIFVITGVSGAGKSQALKVLEDFGWFCVDNLPIALLDEFAAFVQKSPAMTRVALGMDVREGRVLGALPPLLRRLKLQGLDVHVLFIDAADAIVIHRFSETRHRHPLGGKIADAVKQERKLLAPIKGTADKVIDTTRLTLGELKEKISETLGLTLIREMTLQVLSFGYKHGMPIDADIVMDVRFLPNPHYQPGLRRRTGLEEPVQKYILAQPVAPKIPQRVAQADRDLAPALRARGEILPDDRHRLHRRAAPQRVLHAVARAEAPQDGPSRPGIPPGYRAVTERP